MPKRYLLNSLEKKQFENALNNAQSGIKISQIGNDEEKEEKADSSQQIIRLMMRESHLLG